MQVFLGTQKFMFVIFCRSVLYLFSPFVKPSIYPFHLKWRNGFHNAIKFKENRKKISLAQYIFRLELKIIHFATRCINYSWFNSFKTVAEFFLRTTRQLTINLIRGIPNQFTKQNCALALSPRSQNVSSLFLFFQHNSCGLFPLQGRTPPEKKQRISKLQAGNSKNCTQSQTISWLH